MADVYIQSQPHINTVPHIAMVRIILVFYCMLLFSNCALITPEPGIGKPVKWSSLEDWENDRHAESWPSLVGSCTKLSDQDEWRALCQAVQEVDDPSDEQAREFYERWFTAHAVYAEGGVRDGLITGYYEPLLLGSLESSDRFRYPIFERPDDLLTVDLSGLYPELDGKRVRGRLDGNKVIPYYNRASLNTDPQLLTGHELAWVDDPVALFFLHVQGSGRLKLRDGQIIGVAYADQNGHPYRSIGKELIDRGEIKQEDVNLFSIREWLKRHSEQAQALLERNPSYIFFSLKPESEDGPHGSLNVPLVAERAIAVDRKVIPLGLPVWLDTTVPGSNEPYRRLVLAQDTGGAIKGHVRADLFWGQGDRAERMAGLMKQPGRLYVLKPK